MPEPQKGDWVKVWAQVRDSDPHPEEYTVRFESHNERYKGLVRRDHVIFDEDEVPDFVSQCTSLYVGLGESLGQYWRCTKVEAHPRMHEANQGRLEWTDEQEAGHFDG